MEKKRLFATLLGVGLAVGTPWQGFAQEQAAPQQAAEQPAETAMPPQEVTDAGVEAVREAQETAVAPVAKFQDAAAVLRAEMRKRKWKNGWDDKKKRIIVVESADFKTADPASDDDFFKNREQAAKKAVLTAKVEIIESINSEMSAMDLVNIPGSDINKELGAERERLNKQLAQQKEILVKMLAKVDKAEADVLRGTTFGDRLNDLMAAAIKKLDKEYDASARDKAAKARYEAAKAEFETVQRKYNEMKEKAEAMHEKIQERQESSVSIMAKMPLYGSTVIMQNESWNPKTGIYKVAVMVCWSYTMERSARAIATGEDYKVKPSANAKSIEEWLEGQNLASMVGPRTYLDKDGNRYFIGITARPVDDELSSSARRENKRLTDRFARQMAAFCIWADVESSTVARQMSETRGNKKVNRIAVAETISEMLTQKFENKTIRGLDRIYNDEVTHPISGHKIYVAVFGISPKFAKTALAIEQLNYATKVMDNRYQTVERGRRAANKAAVKASENRAEDFNKGYNKQSNAIKRELDSRRPVKRGGVKAIYRNTQSEPTQKRQSTGGTFGGDAEVSDDF